MSITIRKANPQDFPRLLFLIKEFAQFQQTPEKVMVTVEQMKEDEHLFQCFVAEADSKDIIGFASFFFAYYSWSGKAIYLDDLYVTTPFRKQSVGKQLLQAVLDLATNEGCKKVRWQVSKWNINAIGFYKKIGAVVDDIEINCDYIIV